MEILKFGYAKCLVAQLTLPSVSNSDVQVHIPPSPAIGIIKKKKKSSLDMIKICIQLYYLAVSTLIELKSKIMRHFFFEKIMRHII